MPDPLVSVIIVNHNGIDFINDCLVSVFNSQYHNLEVILVDNGSSDGSLEYVKKTFAGESGLRIVENQASLGPAVGRNRGAAVSRGRYLLFLDNDTKIETHCIQELVTVLEGDHSIGLAQAKLLQLERPQFYDCAGDYLGGVGFLVDRARRAADHGQFDKISEIFSAKSAASIIRKTIFDKIKGFDADFYMYLEETDLCWRVWLSGYSIVFVPQAIVWHAFGGIRKKSKARTFYPKNIVKYYGCRNYIITLIKNLELRNLIKILPLHIFSWLALAFLFLLKGKPLDSYYIIKGIGWVFLNPKALITKRRSVQKFIRAVPDAFIMEKVATQEKLLNYIKKSFIYLGT